MMTAVAPTVSEAIRTEAERLDLSYSDVMANVLAAHYGYPPTATPAAQSDQMRLSA
jgi:hypothetical protein